MTMTPATHPQPKQLWTPPSPSTTQMDKFRQFVNGKHKLNLNSYAELWNWSTTEIERFWEDVVEFTDVVYSQPWTQVLEQGVRMDKIPKWFMGMKLNFAENLLRYRDDHTAIIATGENDTVTKLSYSELYTQVSKCALALREMGIVAGDRVAAYIPNCPEAVIIMLAATSIGAVWSSTSPDFGTTGVLERFAQVKPRVLFSVNAVVYNGKTHDHLGKLKSVVEELGCLEKIVVIPFVKSAAMDLNGIGNGKAITWDAFMTQPDNQPIVFEQLPFNHPVYILYSSGTTGKPKCLVHSAGGTLLQHKKEHMIHGNMKREDVFFQYTTTGWMMWNWLMSTLSIGATIVLYDGSPFKPTPERLWEITEEFNVSIFGTSAKYIQSLQEADIHPGKKFKLSALHSIYSTGSPLKPESFEYVYGSIKKDVLLGSITGGTDIISLFAGHNTDSPVFKGEIQCRCLGMRVEAWDELGKSVMDQAGDLVCTKPFPCMPVFFWDDASGEKYHNAYFSKFEGVWYHGDFVFINSVTGGLIMLGRSDGTLNPSGVRFGSAELYNIVETFPVIADSLVVGQKRGDDERVIMFLKMAPGNTFTDELVNALKNKIRAQLSPRHVPAFVLEIGDIPYTVNGKKVEVAVKRILSGEMVVPSGQLANPECLELFRGIEVLK